MRIRISLFLVVLFVIACETENSAPTAVFTCTPPDGTINTLFDLDASASIDPDGLKSLLTYRWDVNGDGIWETGFGPAQYYSCRFSGPGTYEIRLEVKDSYEAVTRKSFTVVVDSLHHITDPRDGQVYPVVKIGSYWWMGRNLNIGGAIQKYVYPTDDPDGLNGGLYTWNDVMANTVIEGGQGICPPGWHVPSDGDWRNMLAAFRGAIVHNTHTYQIWGEKWVPDQTVTHDSYLSYGAIWRLLRETGSSGFDAVMVGYRDPDGLYADRDYHFPGHTATFWTSTMYADRSIRVRLYQTDTHEGDLFKLADNRQFAFSVRCVKESL
jgi:uncharacterized protein (TIGR02145 family)